MSQKKDNLFGIIIAQLFMGLWVFIVLKFGLEALSCDTMMFAGGGGGGGGQVRCVAPGERGNLPPWLVALMAFTIAGVLIFFMWVRPAFRWLYRRLRTEVM